MSWKTPPSQAERAPPLLGWRRTQFTQPPNASPVADLPISHLPPACARGCMERHLQAYLSFTIWSSGPEFWGSRCNPFLWGCLVEKTEAGDCCQHRTPEEDQILPVLSPSPLKPVNIFLFFPPLKPVYIGFLVHN